MHSDTAHWDVRHQTGFSSRKGVVLKEGRSVAPWPDFSFLNPQLLTFWTGFRPSNEWGLPEKEA